MTDLFRRNEVWIQCLEPAAPVVAEVEDIDSKKTEVGKSEEELAEAVEEELATEEIDANAVINTRTEESEDVEDTEDDEDDEDEENVEVAEEDEDDEVDAEESVEADEVVVADADAAVADADADA